MERIHLYVSPEEYPDVEALGAFWDDQAKRWYIGQDMDSAEFSRWLGDGDEQGYTISSDEAFVSTAQVACRARHADIEVVALYCDSGVDREADQALSQFTVSNVWAMDDALLAQIGAWPFYRQTSSAESDAGSYGNHCPHCGAVQEDYSLHSEPGDVFFGLSRGDCPWVEFTKLEGMVQLSGDCSFRLWLRSR